MLPALTKYLLTHKQVYIPHIGRFELVQKPARLDIADKLIYPPHFEILHSEAGSLKDNQLYFLSSQYEKDTEKTKADLDQFGQELKRELHHAAFTWNGFGTLNYRFNKIEFAPQDWSILPPVSAYKILRDNVQHTVLVGDHEVQSGPPLEFVNHSERLRSLTTIIGWIVVLLAAGFIAWHLYTLDFKEAGTGSQEKIEIRNSLQAD